MGSLKTEALKRQGPASQGFPGADRVLGAGSTLLPWQGVFYHLPLFLIGGAILLSHLMSHQNWSEASQRTSQVKVSIRFHKFG